MANEKQLEILRQGVKVWNRWREEHPNERIDLREAGLFAATLRGTDLREANLREAILSQADLREANLSRANLSEATLIEADLRKATLRGVDLGGADLRRVDLENTIFQDAQEIPDKWIIQGLDAEGKYSQERLIEAIRNGFKNLRGADLSKANLREADLCEADLCEASLFGATLREADLRKANLSGVDLSGMDLIGANLSRATLIKADLRGANLSKATLSGATLSEATLSEATLSGANLSGADLRKANLSEAILFDANLFDANLFDANLSRAILCGLDLSRATLSEAYLRAANLSEANLSGATLSGATLSKAYLRTANLSGANLSGANLSGADLCHVNLGRVNLSQATITGVCLYNTARDDWMIDGIQCGYVYWDSEGKERTPKDRNFRLGEFEELYKSLPKFDYYFEEGFGVLDIVVMDRVVQAINERHKEFDLQLTNFDKRGTPHATFTVLHKEHLEPAKNELTTDFKTRIIELEAQKKELRDVIKMLGSGGIHIERAGGDVIIKAGQDIVTGNKSQRSISAGRDYLEQVTGDVTTGVSTQGIEAKDMSQLNTKEECMAHYKLLSEKLFELRQAYILETDTEVKFKLKKNIEKYDADLKEIEKRLEELESKEDNTQKA